jgi:hypothetical protein
MVARVCMSDLHLGDEKSVLSAPGVAAQVSVDLAHLTGGRIDQLVLNGDVWEECVPVGMDRRTEDGFACSVVMASRTFFSALFLHNRVDEIVWVPGNHDLSLWHDMAGKLAYTEACGALIDDPRLDVLTRSLRPFRIAYPVFMPEHSPWILFSHGHFMNSQVRGIAPDLEYAALAALGCSRPKTSVEGMTVTEIAKATDPFSLALWKRYSQIGSAYQRYVMRSFDDSPSDPCAALADAHHGSPQRPLMGINTEDRSLFKAVDWFVTAALLDSRIPTPTSKDEPMCFVHGHDHRGTDAIRQICDQQVHVVDSGGWTSDHPGQRPYSRALIWRDKADVDPEVYYLSTPGLP